MLSNTKFLLVTFLCALVLLQSVAALPTGGSYSKLARRANASQKAKRNNGPSAKPAKLRRTIPTSQPAVAPILRAPLVEAVKPTTQIGGEFTQWAAAAGVPVTPISSSSNAQPTAPFVAASNVTLPTAIKRDVQQLAKRVTAHPGAPTMFLTAKVNVIGGDASNNGSSSTGLGFTLVTKTTSSIPVAETSKVVKPENTTMPLPTVTKTLTFTVAPSVTETATVTLVPSQIPGEKKESYIPFSNATSTSADEEECRVVLVKEGEHTSNATICGLPEDAPSSSIDINITINNNVSNDISNDESESSAKKSKRQVIAFFEAPAPQKSYTREEMLSEDWEDCIVGVDAGCLEIPAAQEEKKSYTKEEMMSDDWEDCIVGVDADCMALPDN